MNRLGGVLVVIGLVAAACSDTAATTSTEPPVSATTTTVPSTTTQATTTTVAATTTTTPVPTTMPGFVTALSPEPCLGIGEAPLFGDWEITFVAQGALYAVGSDGGEARCLLQADDLPQAWGAAGDRLLTGGGEDIDAGAVTADGDLPLAVPASRFESASWTRPTGTSVVGIDDDNRLIKYPIDGGPPVDLSFLARHDEVVYHPAGTHVMVVGEAANGDYGIWQATNIGTQPELLVAGVTAMVFEPVVSHDGLFLYFLADHGDGSHMHEVFLVEGATNEFDSSIAFETERPLSDLVVSPWSGDAVVAEGVCGIDLHTVVAWSHEVILPEMESKPIGFLPDSPGSLLIAAWPDGCRADVGPDLYLVELFEDSEPTLVVQGVSQFALPGVRSPLPEAPPPPGNFDFSEFA